jgi:hypothetical protein
MKLNKDGTATLQVGETTLTLPNPTWGQLKKLKARADQISETIASAQASIMDLLNEKQREVLQLGFRVRQATSKEQTEYLSKLNALDDNDGAAITAAAERIKTLPDTAAELAVGWWVETINALTDSGVQGDDLPGYLSTGNSIQEYLIHVETVPFDSGQ